MYICGRKCTFLNICLNNTQNYKGILNLKFASLVYSPRPSVYTSAPLQHGNAFNDAFEKLWFKSIGSLDFGIKYIHQMNSLKHIT